LEEGQEVTGREDLKGKRGRVRERAKAKAESMGHAEEEKYREG
jgi:hypothetical protein